VFMDKGFAVVDPHLTYNQTCVLCSKICFHSGYKRLCVLLSKGLGAVGPHLVATQMREVCRYVIRLRVRLPLPRQLPRILMPERDGSASKSLD